MSDNFKTFIIASGLSILILYLFVSCVNNSAEDNKYECINCERTFTNSTDVNSIKSTDMCGTCYEKFEENRKFYEAAERLSERGY